MDQKKVPSPFAVLWGWASGEHGGFYASVALAVLGVACGMAPVSYTHLTLPTN